jgi:hypothetical protein
MLESSLILRIILQIAKYIFDAFASQIHPIRPYIHWEFKMTKSPESALKAMNALLKDVGNFASGPWQDMEDSPFREILIVIEPEQPYTIAAVLIPLIHTHVPSLNKFRKGVATEKALISLFEQHGKSCPLMRTYRS